MSHDETFSGPNGVIKATGLLEFMRQRGTLLAIPAGSPLYRESEPCDGVFYIESGEVELSIHSGEKKMIVGIARAGNLLGLPCAFRSKGHPQTATAMQECSVLNVEAEKMREFLQNNADSCLQSIQMMGSEILELSANMIRPMRLQPRYPKNH